MNAHENEAIYLRWVNSQINYANYQNMKEMNTWVEVDRKAAPQMIRALDGKNFKGRRIRMNDANSR